MDARERAALKRESDELENEKLQLEEKRKKLKLLATQHRDDLDALKKDEAEADEIDERQAEIEKRLGEIKKIREENPSEQNNQNLQGEIKRIMNAYKNFTDETREDEVYSTQEYRSAYLRNLQSKGRAALTDVEKRAMSTANNAAVIPTQTMDLIIGQLLQMSPLLSSVRRWEIPSNLKIPAVDLVNPAEWVAEGTAGTINTDTTKYINLTAHQLIRLIEITAQVSTMSISAFEAWIAAEMARRMRGAIEYAIYQGSGTNQPRGFSNNIAWNSANQIETTTAALTYDNLVDLEGLLDSTNIISAFYILDRKSLAAVRKLKDENKRPLYERAIEDGFVGRICGIPTKLSDDVKGIYLANWQEAYVFNFAAPIEIVNSIEAGFTKNTTVYRGTALADGAPTNVAGSIARINLTDLIV